MTSPTRRFRVWAMLLAIVLVLPAGVVAAQEQEQDQEVADAADELPPVRIDALEGATWSVSRAIIAPGQRIIITNRDVERHRFALDAWGVDVELPTLEPVTVEVPDTVEPESSYLFYSSEGDDRQSGMTGTFFVVEPQQVLAAAQQQDTVSAAVANRTVVEITDAFQFSPADIQAASGDMIEVRNVGAIEHHFVVDAWGVNQTVPPGETAIIQVPSDLGAGESFEFYCSVPGHLEMGMQGTLSIAPDTSEASLLPVERGMSGSDVDLRPFVPASEALGENWEQIRSGNARSMISGQVDLNTRVFPGEGLGAVYAGPHGSRATVIVLPLSTDTLPVNQVEDAVEAVQRSMMQSWSTDRISGVAAQELPPPSGCDVAMRSTGIVPVLTIPAASTVCELRSAGVVVFVSIEGEIDGESGIAASDELVARVLSGGVESWDRRSR